MSCDWFDQERRVPRNRLHLVLCESGKGLSEDHDKAYEAADFRKGADLDANLAAVKSVYPTCVDFERQFPSMTFALATGVGKTRLMGAFVTWLYAQKGIKNFFIVAPDYAEQFAVVIPEKRMNAVNIEEEK